MDQEKNIRIAIIDYGLSNLFSVQNAFRYLGLDATITNNCAEIESADGAILPGVGAFDMAMRSLERQDLIAPITDFVRSGKPFMGICLGLQLLFSESEEFGTSRGLDLIEGYVRRLPNEDIHGNRIKVPQIGWNRIYNAGGSNKTAECTPLRNTAEGEFMYFVHSFYVVPHNPERELKKTKYKGFEYCSSIQYENLFGVQFHPEKSGEKGIQIYANWGQQVKEYKEGVNY